MLYGAFKLAVLKKIDPKVNSLTPERKTAGYLNAIVEATNRGLEDLATAGKYITKSYTITQQKPCNIIPMPLYLMNIYQHGKEDEPYEAQGATAYYFEVNGTATIEIKVGGTVIETIENTVKERYTAYKKKIANPDGETVVINFTGDYPYQYRNIALYDANFESDNDVWEYVSRKRYDMRTLTDDFYRLVTHDIVFTSGFNETEYSKTTNYEWEGDSVLVLDGQQPGEWTVHYYAYPSEVTVDTPDSYDLALDPEVAQLLIVRTASDLYETKRPDIAQYWMELYDSGKAGLNPSQEIGKQSTFQNVNGW